jgi:hypothetical protein
MESKTVKYTVTPASETSSVNWVIADSKYVSFIDDHAGNLTVVTKDTEGTTTITGTTPSHASAFITVHNAWGNTLSVDKKILRTIPVDYNDGTFEVNYEVKPAVSQIKVLIADDTKLRLKAGTYASYSAVDRTYTITAHASSDAQSGVAKGKIRFEPTGETATPVTVFAHNPSVINGGAGSTQPYDFGNTTINLQIYYTSYKFIQDYVSRAGSYSRYDQGNGTFIIGDGESYNFTLRTDEVNGTPRIQSVSIETVGAGQEALPSGAPWQGYFVSASYYGGNTYGINHSTDYKGSFNGQSNTDGTVMAVPMIGYLAVTYQVYGDNQSKVFRFPVYVEVRNCPR